MQRAGRRARRVQGNRTGDERELQIAFPSRDARPTRVRAGPGRSAQGECSRFLAAAVAHFAKLGVRIERVMTDNGSCYQSKMFRAACKRLGLRQVFTRPYTPRTNGKAERFIQ